MHRQVAEIVNSLSELIAAVGFIGCNLAHSKICLAQHNALRVNSYENFRYRFNVQIWRQLDDSDLLLWYVHQDANGLFDVKFIYVRIPICVFADRRIRYFELFLSRIKGDFDAYIVIVLVDDVLTKQSGP